MATQSKKANSQRQLAWVFDLNKCIGCQTCSVACKILWTEEEGTEPMWWMTVNTQPGRGAPRDWETMGGGYKNGEAQLGNLPTEDEFGGGWDYNYEEVLRGGKGRSVHLTRNNGPPPTSSPCPGSATTAPARPAWRYAPMTRCSSAPKTGSSSAMRAAARACRTAPAPAPP